MRRRDFVTLAAGAAAWPTVGQTQQAHRAPRVGVLMGLPEDDPDGRAWIAVFRQALDGLGWVPGRTAEFVYRWSAGDPDRMRAYAAELVSLDCDVILAATTFLVATVQKILKPIPVVFVQVTDPVRTGFVETLARPGGNMTGFTSFEYSVGGKWVELLEQLQAGITNIAVLENPHNANHTEYLRMIEAAAIESHLSVAAADISDSADIERAVARIAAAPGSGLIVPPDPSTLSRRAAVVELTRRYRLPAIYAFPPFVQDGGLMSYGVDNKDMYARAAGYVDRILRGEKPRDLPVQASRKFELLINMNAAKAIGLSVPASLLARADEVIE